MHRALMTCEDLKRRLRSMIAARGRPPPFDARLKIADAALETGVHPDALYRVARGQREIDASLQAQLTNFFALVDGGCIVKVREGDDMVLRRRIPAAGVAPAPRARIDLTGPAPRVLWSR